MRCPYCKYAETKVLETREAENDTRRRRECLKCEKRFTTYEQVEILNIFVVKKNGSKEAFNRQKILNGMIRACEKRPISMDQLEDITEEIETKLMNHKKNEVRTSHIGEMIMRRLRKIDMVAYIRFASVYKDFNDLNSFEEELRDLTGQEEKQGNNPTNIKAGEPS
jgi:transcriptional repressor NrdR